MRSTRWTAISVGLRAPVERHHSRAFSRKRPRRAPAVRSYREELSDFGDLRNAIVHTRRQEETVIAEPNDWAVGRIEEIVKVVDDPPKVLPEFSREVFQSSSTEGLAKAVRQMRDSSYSQIPVYNDGVCEGLLTANTIVRWLGASVDDDLFSLIETQIGEVLQHQEDAKGYRFIPRSTTLFDVLELFQAECEKERPPVALLITENGRHTERLLGIITAWDLPRVHRRIGAGIEA